MTMLRNKFKFWSRSFRCKILDKGLNPHASGSYLSNVDSNHYSNNRIALRIKWSNTLRVPRIGLRYSISPKVTIFSLKQLVLEKQLGRNELMCKRSISHIKRRQDTGKIKYSPCLQCTACGADVSGRSCRRYWLIKTGGQGLATGMLNGSARLFFPSFKKENSAYFSI
jgi:hypothetical protein